MARGFARLALYREMLVKTFRAYGLPPELIYMALVESAYDVAAQSPAGARGLWQFMPETGRRYGLEPNGKIDMRTDPVQSTIAAARYLRDLYGLFGDWPLALAAYNAGEGRVLKTMLKTGVRDFWSLAEKRLLPEETIHYVPAVLAVMQIAQNQPPMEVPQRATSSEGR